MGAAKTRTTTSTGTAMTMPTTDQSQAQKTTDKKDDHGIELQDPTDESRLHQLPSKVVSARQTPPAVSAHQGSEKVTKPMTVAIVTPAIAPIWG